jgi:hypothetical protein
MKPAKQPFRARPSGDGEAMGGITSALPRCYKMASPIQIAAHRGMVIEPRFIIPQNTIS